MTFKAPSGTGYFWWTNFGEHTPTIMRVTRSRGQLYASDGEYEFAFSPGEEEISDTPEDEDDDPVLEIEGKGYYHGTSMWSESPIELPEINGEFIQPDSF